jgi:hypothetical protein
MTNDTALILICSGISLLGVGLGYLIGRLIGALMRRPLGPVRGTKWNL